MEWLPHTDQQAFAAIVEGHDSEASGGIDLHRLRSWWELATRWLALVKLQPLHTHRRCHHSCALQIY